jgi:Flp pilus assembly protein CpaB
MVDSKQAEALQLAVTYGRISLAMRNPLDKSPIDSEATLLSQGRLAKLGSALNPTDLTAEGEKDQIIGEPPETKEVLPQEKPSWSMTVIRGTDVKEQDLDIQK